MKASYSSDPTLESHANTIRKIRLLYPDQRLFIVIYEETIITYGISKFIDLILECNIETVILVASTSRYVTNELKKNQIKIASFVRYHLPQKEVDIARQGNGFVYLESKPSKEYLNTKDSLKQVIDKLKNELGVDKPIYCGVGISNSNDVRHVKEAGGDGVFIGSALLKKEHDKLALINFIKDLKKEM